jgi:hypothetical protein
MKMSLGLFTVLAPLVMMVLAGAAFLAGILYVGSARGALLAVIVVLVCSSIGTLVSDRLVDHYSKSSLRSNQVGLYLGFLAIAAVASWITIGTWMNSLWEIGFLVTALAICAGAAISFVIGFATMDGVDRLWIPLAFTPAAILGSTLFYHQFNTTSGIVLYCILVFVQAVVTAYGVKPREASKPVPFP